MDTQEIINVHNVSKIYQTTSGKSTFALKDVSLSVRDNEFVSLVGPSGCGKTTLIKILAGLVEPTTGDIHGIDGDKKISERLGVMFQNYSLFPWLTVEENIEFGLLLQKVPSVTRKKISSHYIEVTGLKGFAQSYPKELSGGMQQRVALARTLAINPKILLMDEPFTALDVQTKRFMQDLLLQILKHEPRMVIFVTHDVEEAVFMSDTVYIMSARPGSIQEKIIVDLPRPRDFSTETSDKFIKLKTYVQKAVTKEALGFIQLDLDIYKDL